jgi:uncharacterized protein YciI
MKALVATLVLAAASLAPACAFAQAPDAAFDADLAKSVGADDFGMRPYVLVILKTGPTPLPAGKERDEVFKGHFANMKRLTDERKLAVAGPLDGVQTRRGIFILAVKDIEEARQLTATDPVIASGEMSADFHRFYSSAALMLVNENHKKLAKKNF